MLKFLKVEIHDFLSSEDLYLITSFLGMDSQTYMKSFEKARIGSHCEFKSEPLGVVLGEFDESKRVKLDRLEPK